MRWGGPIRWVLCGPDKASLRFGIRLGLRDRLVALEGLFQAAGHKPRAALKENYTSKWLDKALGEMVMAEGPKRK